MKVNFNVNFRTYAGEETSERIFNVVAQCLFNYGKDRQAKREDKFRAYMLSQRIMQNPGEVSITTEDATLIKEACSDIMTAGGYGQIYQLIEK